jgi:hypothetical protein
MTMTTNTPTSDRETKPMHTPGELVIRFGGLDGDDHFVIASSRDRGMVCEYAAPLPRPSSEVIANARRIVAAWNAHDDLLEACRWALTALRHKAFCPAAEKHGECNCGLFHIEKAVAKATGGAL